MLQIIINDNQYRQFIKHAMATCDTFSLIFEKDDNDNTKYLFQEFYYMLCECELDKKSIGYHPDTGTSFQNSDIVYFACNEHTRAILLTAQSVFDWDGQTLPEELCFYRKSEKWFICIYHERCLSIYNEMKSDIEFFDQESMEYWYPV